MITTYIQGGIGNQMFQYATGLALAKRFDTGLRLNISGFNRDPMREYSLHLWGGVTEKLDPLPLGENIVCEEGLPFNPETVKQFTRDCSIRGYWQSEEYFKDVT